MYKDNSCMSCEKIGPHLSLNPYLNLTKRRRVYLVVIPPAPRSGLHSRLYGDRMGEISFSPGALDCCYTWHSICPILSIEPMMNFTPSSQFNKLETLLYVPSNLCPVFRNHVTHHGKATLIVSNLKIEFCIPRA